MVWSHASTDIDIARLLAASSPHSGDWLAAAAPPIPSVGLRLSYAEIRIAVAHRLGCRACEPHTCVCGEAVDTRRLHGLACRRSAPRQQRHSHLNDIIWRAMKRTQIPAVKEPASRSDDARREASRWHHHSALVERQGISLGRYDARYIHRRSRGQHSQRSGSSSQPCSDQQEHQVQPAIQHSCVRFGGGGTGTGDWKTDGQRYRRCQGIFLFQQLSVALRRGNAVSFQNTFTVS